jgi:hypothetical protein
MSETNPSVIRIALVTCLDCRAGVGQRGHNLSRGSRRVTLVLLTVQAFFVRDPGNRLGPSGALIRALARRVIS